MIMNLKKRTLGMLLAAALTLSATPGLAYDLPSSYWSINDQYGIAVENNDNAGIIEFGTKIVDLISKEESNEQTQNILASRSYNVGFSYFLTGDYQNAEKYFNLHIPYGKQLGWDENVYIASQFSKQLHSTLEVYQHTNTEQKTYGVKNEPHGVLYGQVSEETQPDDSMLLLYLEYGDTASFDWAKRVLGEASSQNRSIELALNFPNQGDTARSVSASDSYLSALYSLLSPYPNVPIYLRIGAEVNIWGNVSKPEEFKSAFRTIADKMHGLPNISTVWSVAHTSTWESDSFPYTADDFYPGDDCVDWVGVNCYSNKYFDGQIWNGISRFNEICFKTGYSADPVLMVQDIVNAYGDRKPIMISECGSAYQTTGSVNETHEQWAANYAEQIYSFIPMVYPQVKLIAYFNKKIPHEVNYYDLHGSSVLAAAYNKVTKSPWLIQKSNQNSAQTFFKKADGTITTDGTLTLSTYPHLYGSDSITVDYYLDGTLQKTTSEIPYTTELNNLTDSHILKVTAKGNNGAEISREYTIESSKKSEKTENTGTFSDIASLSAIQKQAIDYVVQNGIITGYEDNTLRPDNTITRAEFAAMICRMKKYTTDTPCTFDDAKDHWGTNYINACVKAGAINGVGNNQFAPNDQILFEQAVKIVTVVSGKANSDAHYPDGFIAAAVGANMLENLTNTKLGTPLNRMDAAMIMYNAMQ